MIAYKQFFKTFCLISKFILRLAFRNGELVSNLLKLRLSLIFNPLLPGVAFIYPPKTSENLRFLESLKREHREVMCWKWESGNGFSIDFFVDYMPFLNPFPRTLFQKASTIFKQLSFSCQFKWLYDTDTQFCITSSY